MVTRLTDRLRGAGPQKRWLVDGDVGPGRSDDHIAVNGNSQYRFRQITSANSVLRGSRSACVLPEAQHSATSRTSAV
jgi:hypothetical protein